MKRAIPSALAIAGLTFSGHGQGIITFDDTESASGNVLINGVLDTTTDINAELLYYNGTAYEPVVTLLLSDSTPVYGNQPWGVTEPAAGDITLEGNAQLLDNSGNTYQNPYYFAAGTVVTFEVAGWTGDYDSWNAALDSANLSIVTGITQPFTVALSDPVNPILANISNMGILSLVGPIPEPTTMALGVLGGLGLLLFRRKQV